MEERRSRLSSMAWKRLQPYSYDRLIPQNSMSSNFCHVLKNQLKLAKRVNLFDYSLEELQAVHEYWRSMNRYSKQVLNKEKVA